MILIRKGSKDKIDEKLREKLLSTETGNIPGTNIKHWKESARQKYFSILK
jgi:hypothetical protein